MVKRRQLRELRDLAAAWIALGIAFALFLNPRPPRQLLTGSGIEFAYLLLKSLLTVGIGFLLHELAHKLVAIHFGQDAMFQADYGMLGIAILAGLAGILFAAPGAVHHRGMITNRENGLIALAGPIMNLMLAAVFLPLTVVGGFVGEVGGLGVLINIVLAAFNMIPFGPLDGRKVLNWNPIVFVLVFVGSAGLALLMLLG